MFWVCVGPRGAERGWTSTCAAKAGCVLRRFLQFVVPCGGFLASGSRALALGRPVSVPLVSPLQAASERFLGRFLLYFFEMLLSSQPK